MNAAGPVLCFGEILWDILPQGAFPGGAPFNVAYHLHRLGVPVLPVSAVGRDAGGSELLRRLNAWGISTEAVALDPSAPTGTVTATLGPAGDAHYEIATEVAWDHLPVDAVRSDVVRHAAGLVYGSLALRSKENREALSRLEDELPLKAWRIFDINLRAPFDDLDVVRKYAPLARVLKMNATEAARLATGESPLRATEETYARRLANEFGTEYICITAAERGAGLLHHGHWTWSAGPAVRVVDTIGAGDAFLAALICGLLGGRSDAAILEGATKLGGWVASHAGATPEYDATTPVQDLV